MDCVLQVYVAMYVPKIIVSSLIKMITNEYMTENTRTKAMQIPKLKSNNEDSNNLCTSSYMIDLTSTLCRSSFHSAKKTSR